MQRRHFLGLPIFGAILFGGGSAEVQRAMRSGPLANATMSFGAWRSDLQPPTDRHSNPQSSMGINWHPVTPEYVTLAEGGTVNFIIAGLHQIAVYEDGVQPLDINTALSAPDAANLIDDPRRRMYRGLNPVPLRTPLAVGTTIEHAVSRDRVEVVHFAAVGTYLVICTVRAHFVNDHMWGWVRVIQA